MGSRDVNRRLMGEDYPYIEMGARCKLARLRAGLSQQGCAEKIGTSDRTIYSWETGHLPKDPALFLRFAEVCRTDVEWLYTGVEE